MSKFLQIGKIIINFDEIHSIERYSNWDLIEQKITSIGVRINLKTGGNSIISFDSEKEAIALLDEIGKKLEAVVIK